jgi:pre-mRNA-splicing factor SYF1
VDTNGTDGERADAMQQLDRVAKAPMGFVPASTGPQGSEVKRLQEMQQAPATETAEVQADRDEDDL